jgi:hypothetical protein
MNMPLAILNRRRRGFTAFSPAALFALAEPGVWYDPSDLSTLFQDVAGTIPVTTPGQTPAQTVALMLDKSKGLVLGANTATRANAIEDDTNGVTGWTSTRAGMLVSQSSVTNDSSFAFAVNESGGAVSAADRIYTSMVGLGANFGDWVKVTFDWRHVGVGSSSWRAGPSASTVNPSSLYAIDIIPSNTSWRTETIIFEVSDSFDFFVFQENGPNDGGVYIDNFRVQTLPGNHATQGAIASRPIYGVVPQGGRRNLLTFSEQLDNAVWYKSSSNVVANSTNDPTGAATGDAVRLNAGTSLTVAASGLFTNSIPYASLPTAVALTAGIHTYSVYVKGGVGLTHAQLRVSTSFSLNPTIVAVVVRLSDGELTGGSGGEAVSNAGGGWWRVSIPFTATAAIHHVGIWFWNDTSIASAAGTEGVYLWGAQLETGSTATNYQRVTTQYDVTEAGVQSLSYLFFDGAANFMVTPTITPGTDKAQVFAGVRKLSDAARGMISEFSTTTANNGSFGLEGPGFGAGATYGWTSKGTSNGTVTPSGFAAPITNVLTGLGDISGDLATLRSNGIQVAETLTDQGTGNYLAYPLYLGRRGGTTLPYNGQLYSLVVRFGANLDATVISSTETFVAGKTGVTL